MRWYQKLVCAAGLSSLLSLACVKNIPPSLGSVLEERAMLVHDLLQTEGALQEYQEKYGIKEADHFVANGVTVKVHIAERTREMFLETPERLEFLLDHLEKEV